MAAGFGGGRPDWWQAAMRSEAAGQVGGTTQSGAGAVVFWYVAAALTTFWPAGSLQDAGDAALRRILSAIYRLDRAVL